MKTNIIPPVDLITKIIALISVAICLQTGCDDGRLYPMGYDNSGMNNKEDATVDTNTEQDSDAAPPYADNDTESESDSDSDSDSDTNSCPWNSGYPCACDLENGELCEDGSQCVVPKKQDIGICTWPCSWENLSISHCWKTGNYNSPFTLNGICEITPSISSDRREQYCFPTCSDFYSRGAENCPPGLHCDTLFNLFAPIPDEWQSLMDTEYIEIDFSVCVPPWWKFYFPPIPPNRSKDTDESQDED